MTAPRRIERPTPTMSAGWAFPQPTRITLDNGMGVLLHHLPGRKLAALRLAVAAPMAGESRRGLTQLSGSLWSEGVRGGDANDFANRLEMHGATFSVSATYDGLIAAIDVPGTHLAAVLAVLADCVIEPRYADADIDRLVRARESEHEAEQADSDTRAETELQQRLFAAGCRESAPIAGTPADLAGVEATEVREFHASHVRPGNATLVVAGDLDGIDVHAAIASAFQSWSGTGGIAVHAAPVCAPPSTGLVDRPEAAQTALVWGVPTVGEAGFGDAGALTLALQIIGGGMGSRLNQVLRDDHGYTYGISAYVRRSRLTHVVQISGAVETTVTGAAINAAEEVVRQTLASGFADSERDRAAAFILGTGPVKFQSSSAIAERSATRWLQGRPVDDYNLFARAIAASSADDAAQALRAAIPGGAMSLSAVGDADEVAEQIAGARGGELDVRAS